MYSRSLDPRRIPSPLPTHYGGSAFRPDGTPTPIPVKRIPDTAPQFHPSPKEDTPEDTAHDLTPPLLFASEEDTTAEEPHEAAEASAHAEESDAPLCEEASDSEDGKTDDSSFLSRMLGGLLPGVREDDLLLLLLILLLSKEENNEEILLLLSFLLLAK